MKDDKDISLAAFLQQAKEKNQSHISNQPSVEAMKAQLPAGSVGPKELLSSILHGLIELADGGDREVQDFLIQFGMTGRYLLETMPTKSGDSDKPCASCGKKH